VSQNCAFCGVTVADQPRNSLYREVIGWARPGKGSGGQSGSSLVLRKDTGAVAHSTCIEAAKRGVHVNQDALWSE
jgi:hypothetical protein